MKLPSTEKCICAAPPSVRHPKGTFVGSPRGSGFPIRNHEAQTDFFSAATQKAFTTVVAGFAFTMTTLPNTSLLPALVAGFRRVLTMQRPGMVNFPAFLTSLAPTSARLLSTLTQSDFFNSVEVASASAMPVFERAFAPAFMPAALGAIGNGLEINAGLVDS